LATHCHNREGLAGVKLHSTPGVRGVVRRLIIRARVKFGLISLTAEQAVIVRAFIQCALSRKVPNPQRASIILVETGIVESGLRILANPNVPESENIPHAGEGSDHASVGPLQQQVPMWGTAADCMNPYTSAGKFLDHLTSFDWQSLPTGTAAQDVQVSAFPDRYQAQEQLATAIVNQLWAQPAPIPTPIVSEDEVAYIVQVNPAELAKAKLPGPVIVITDGLRIMHVVHTEDTLAFQAVGVKYDPSKPISLDQYYALGGPRPAKVDDPAAAI
jgi:hypothetical protein